MIFKVSITTAIRTEIQTLTPVIWVSFFLPYTVATNAQKQRSYLLLVLLFPSRIYHAVIWPCWLCSACCSSSHSVFVYRLNHVRACLRACVCSPRGVSLLYHGVVDKRIRRVTQRITAAWSQPGERVWEVSVEMASPLCRSNSSWQKRHGRNFLRLL